MPASWYCPIRSMASDTVPKKARDGPRAVSRSRFAAAAAPLRARSQPRTWVFSICRNRDRPRRNGDAAPPAYAVPPQYRRRRCCGIGQAGDRAQRHLFAAAGDQHWRTRLLHRLRFEDRILGVEIPAVEGRARFGPRLQVQLNRFLHLPDAGGRPRREFPAVLPVFILEKAGADAERHSPSADQIDGRRDLREMRGISITNRRAKGGETNTRGDSGQRRQHGPAFQERLIGRAHAGIWIM
jgi:hypothetical protein